MKTIQAVKDKVAVEILDSLETTTEGGIVIPETVTQNSPFKVGKVLSYGNEVADSIEIKVGDIIAFAKFGGQDIILNNKIIKILCLGEIYGVIKEG